MSLVDDLLKADTKKAEELKQDTYDSERLGFILGINKPVKIKIQEIMPRKMKSIQARMFTNKGRLDMEKTVDAQALCLVEGVIDPDLKNKDLRERYGCATPVDLAIKLFRAELEEISDAICLLSGVSNKEDEEEEIKN